MKVLITGATGFVGSHLCELLHSQGHEVFALIRNPEKAKKFNIPGSYIIGTLRHDLNHTWIKALPDDLDCVIHTAGIVHSMSVKKFYQTNSDATALLFEDLKKRYDNLNFIFISSLAVGGPSLTQNPITEEDLPRPVSHYGKSKLKAEHYLRLNAPPSFNITVLRPPMVIGPRDTAILDIFKMVSSGVVINAGKSKEKFYSFICVHDLVQMISETLTNPAKKSFETFYTSHPQVIKFSELILLISKKLKRKKLRTFNIPTPIIKFISKSAYFLTKVLPFLDIRLTPDKVHEILPSRWVCDSSKIHNEFNFDSKWDIEKTIDETFSDYRNRDWI